MMEKLLALSLAGILVAPPVGLASESALNDGKSVQSAEAFSGKLPLPPVPYLDTMPWMNFGWESKGSQIDTILVAPSDVLTITKNSAFANNSSTAGSGE